MSSVVKLFLILCCNYLKDSKFCVGVNYLKSKGCVPFVIHLDTYVELKDNFKMYIC